MLHMFTVHNDGLEWLSTAGENDSDLNPLNVTQVDSGLQGRLVKICAKWALYLRNEFIPYDVME